MTTAQTERARLVAAHEDAAVFYRRTLLGPEGDGPRNYLADRGFAALLGDTRWTVGYAPPGWTRLRDHLTTLGYSDQTLLDAGLTRLSRRGTPIDAFRNRITFAIRDLDGGLVGFTARSAPDSAGHVPKYLNTSSTAIYDKSQTLFGLGESAGHHDTVVITEGPLDAIAVDLACHSQGRRAVALCGTAITDHHRCQLTELEPTLLVLAFDNDPAGAQARENAYRLLRDTAEITAIDGPGPVDIADTLRAQGPRAVMRTLDQARPAIDAIIEARLATWPNRTDDAEAAIACLRSIARLVA